jgi:hypothetical protein
VALIGFDGVHRTIIEKEDLSTPLSEGKLRAEAGIDDFLAKPVQCQALGACLKRWLKPADLPGSLGERI